MYCGSRIYLWIYCAGPFTRHINVKWYNLFHRLLYVWVLLSNNVIEIVYILHFKNNFSWWGQTGYSWTHPRSKSSRTVLSPHPDQFRMHIVYAASLVRSVSNLKSSPWRNVRRHLRRSISYHSFQVPSAAHLGKLRQDIPSHIELRGTLNLHTNHFSSLYHRTHRHLPRSD